MIREEITVMPQIEEILKEARALSLNNYPIVPDKNFKMPHLEIASKNDLIPLPTTETLTFEMKDTTILDITIVDENGVKTMLKVRKPKIKGRSKPNKLSFDIVSHSIPLDSKL